MVRHRTLPPVDDLLAALAEAGVTDTPREAADAHALQGLLDTALFVAEHHKHVSFPDFRWADPQFLVEDAKVTFRVAYAELAADVETTLLANRDRFRDGRTILLLDARRSGAREYDLGHALFGEVTLFQFPSKPPEAADPRIDAARERGWVKALKDHNLLPGRGIVVLDEHQGLLLRDDRFADLVGVLVLFANGLTTLWWNPFVRADVNDPEIQYWLTWGKGDKPASAWRQVFEAERND